jgi:glycosyltransferase involved in cell wall biosynthesis
MNILAVSVRVPRLNGKGDEILSFNRLLSLKNNGHNIVLVCFANKRKSLDLISIRALEECGINVKTVSWSLFEAIKNALLVILKAIPFQCAIFTSKKYQSVLADIVHDFRPDYVHSFLIRPLENCGNLSPPLVVDLIDSMGLNFERRYHRAPLFIKWLYLIEWRRLKKYEFDVADNRSRLSVVVSEVDKEYIGSQKIHIIPLGVDIDHFSPAHKKDIPKSIIFTGNMSYAPNEQAAIWFIDNVWNELLSHDKNLILYIVGSGPKAKLLRYCNSHTSIVITGRVNSVADYINNSTVAIAPMLSGSGMQFKVLEAMACGVPVVTSEIGKGDIRAQNGRQFIVVDINPLIFRNKIVELLNNEELRLQIGINGRQFILENHSWVTINEKFSLLLTDLSIR